MSKSKIKLLMADKNPSVFFLLHSTPNFFPSSCYLKTLKQPPLLQNLSNSHSFMCLLSQHTTVNYLIIRKNYTLLNLQKQFGKFKEFVLYLHSTKEDMRMQFSIYLPAKSGIILIFLFLRPQIAHSVVRINTFSTGVVECASCECQSAMQL